MRFTQEDLFEKPVPPGRYGATIKSVRQTRSRRGNPMVMVTLGIAELDREVTDYFVTAGASPRALGMSRRRLALLCRACGVEPRPNEDFDLTRLQQHAVEIDVIVEAGETGPWNRVTRYRRPATNPAPQT